MEQSAKELDVVNSQISLLNESLSACSLQNVTAASSLSEIQTRGGAIDSALKEKETQISACEKERQDLLRDLDRCEEKLAECANAIRGGEMLISSAQQKLESANEEMQRILLDCQTKKTSRAAAL